MTSLGAAHHDMLGSRTTSTPLAPGLTAPLRPDGGRSERFLRKPEVLSRTGISRSHLYWLMDRGRFPKSIPLSPRVTVWLEQLQTSRVERLPRCMMRFVGARRKSSFGG